MTDLRAIVFFVVVLACRAPTPASSTPQSAPVPQSGTFIVGPERFTPARGDAALQAFVPDVPAVDSGGECRLFRTAGSGATIVTANFPSFDSARAVVSLVFDSAGHLVRFSEKRGLVGLTLPGRLSESQRDSARRAADAATRSTTIYLDYAADNAIASNTGGGRPTRAISGTVRAMEKLPRLGPPTDRLQRVRRLCGV
jgi:hypothetical protein